MSSDEGMSSLPLTDEEAETSTGIPTKKKARINIEDYKKKKILKTGEPAKRKYVRKNTTKNIVASEAPSMNIAWDLVQKSYKEGSAVIILIPPHSEHQVKGVKNTGGI